MDTLQRAVVENTSVEEFRQLISCCSIKEIELSIDKYTVTIAFEEDNFIIYKDYILTELLELKIRCLLQAEFEGLQFTDQVLARFLHYFSVSQQKEICTELTEQLEAVKTIKQEKRILQILLSSEQFRPSETLVVRLWHTYFLIDLDFLENILRHVDISTYEYLGMLYYTKKGKLSKPSICRQSMDRIVVQYPHILYCFRLLFQQLSFIQADFEWILHDLQEAYLKNFVFGKQGFCTEAFIEEYYERYLLLSDIILPDVALLVIREMMF